MLQEMVHFKTLSLIFSCRYIKNRERQILKNLNELKQLLTRRCYTKNLTKNPARRLNMVEHIAVQSSTVEGNW